MWLYKKNICRSLGLISLLKKNLHFFFALNLTIMRILKNNSILKLVNSYLIDASQPSNISYLWNFGVRREKGVFVGICPDSIAYSTIGTRGGNLSCKLREFTLCIANKYTLWRAELKYHGKKRLPSLVATVSRRSHVEDNKPDTQWRDLFSKCILSRIYRYIHSYADYSNQNIICCRETMRQSSKGKTKVEQAAKTTRTLNPNTTELRDLIAYGGEYTGGKYTFSMRKRSFHTSSLNVGAKGNSDNILDNKDTSSGVKNGVGKTKAKKPVGPTLATMVAQKLSELLTHDLKYNKIVTQIIADPHLLIACYEEIKGNPGNMTKGTTPETLDGLKMEWFERVAEELRNGKFDFKPSRRVEIPKPNSNKKRPLTIASPRDKIVQKAFQIIIEAIWENQFLDSSHGFRPGRSVHTALSQIYVGGQNFNWVIQGDISKCFDKIPHNLVIKLIKNKIVDPRFLEIIRKFLEARIQDPRNTKVVEKTTIGIPQGGIVSPILCNIVLHSFDEFMHRAIGKFNKGNRRAHNREYQKLEYRTRKSDVKEERRRLLLEMRRIGNVNKMDPNFRRMKYIRYADDFVVLIIGTKNEAILWKNNIKEFLRVNCGMELNVENTIITNLRDNNFRFLGADIMKLKRNNTFLRVTKDRRKAVATNRLTVKAPIKSLLNKLKSTGFVRQNNSQVFLPQCVGTLTNLSHYDILSFYNSKIHGLLNFYSFASNLNKLGRIIWYLHASCALTLARKLKLGTISKTYKKFGRGLTCPETGKTIFKPENLRVKHQYQKIRKLPRPEDFLGITRASKLN